MGCGTSTTTRVTSLPQKRSVVEIMFRKFDTSNDGKISKNEFRAMCHAMGYNLTQEELDLDMALLDINGDGKIGFNEFNLWWHKGGKLQALKWTGNRQKLIETLTDKFYKYDKDHSGMLDKMEFKELHQDLVTANITTKTFDECLKEMDGSKDGKIAFAEYARFMLKQ